MNTHTRTHKYTVLLVGLYNNMTRVTSWNLCDVQGRAFLEFSQQAYAAMWLQDAGYEHTGDTMSGDNQAEVWTKTGGIEKWTGDN